MNGSRGISFIGSVALLVSSMTGPGLVTIPLLFQTSGWLLPTIMFAIAMSLGASASLLLCEALTTIHGNERFQRKIEFTHLSNLLIHNRKVRIVVQIILYLAIESIIIASIILSAQAMDWMLLKLTGRTCGFSLHPDLGFICVDEETNENSPFGSNYMLATSGFMITLAFCVPLAFLDLVDNIIVQIASFGALVFIIITWIVTFILTGLTKDYIPLVSNDQSQVVGTVLFNYAFITTIPSWVNDLRPDVCIKKSIWYSVIISTTSYIALGILGGMAYQMGLASNIIAEINASSHRNFVTDIATFVFPVAVLLTSIPVEFIVVRYNLVRSGFCEKGMANVLSILLPWLIVIPFQTGYWLNIFTNWASLLFTSTKIDHREKDLESTPEKENKTKQSNESLVTTEIVNPSPKLNVSGTIDTINEKINDNVSKILSRKSSSNSGYEFTLINDIDEIYSNQPSKNSFVAFPIQRKKRIIISVVAGITSIILVGAIITYDLVELSLGHNVFDLNEDN
ncbi:1823_t:CDS:2 [Funneliformis mosseae]|uniref:1823_t:CDS:1 n=1 Tax=Funneliformis mosseae TaxID=27381 RepID=A0A9N8ZH01_FUNMO|nr:1823_t:CDS:2 [Funneliformis mosseae]